MVGLLIPLALLQQDPLAVVVDPIRTNQDITAYHIEVSIPDEGTSIRGATNVAYTFASRPWVLELDFDSVFTIERVTDGNQPLEFNFENNLLRIPVATDHGAVVIYYHGSPQDGLFIQNNVHGHRSAFADNWPDRAHHWFPSEDHPSDKALASFAIYVPAGWKAIANGARVGVDSLPGGRTVWRWRTRAEIPVHTMVIGAGHLAVTRLEDSDGVPNSVWVFPEDSASAVDRSFRRAADMNDRFTDLIGDFPYAKMAHVQSSTRFGGMENSSAIFYSENAVANGRLGEGTVAHEIAHQWFGDAISQTDWHHLWLSEGFATYFAAVYFELAGDTSAYRAALDRARTSYMGSNVVDLPIIDVQQTDLFALLNANNYQKGGRVLHMLRMTIGDDAFFAGIREFYTRFRHGNALSSDLRDVMEAESGRELDRFFEQWLLQPGYPILQVSWSREGENVVVNADQVQAEAWGLYRLDVPVRVTFDDGSTRNLSLGVETRTGNRLTIDTEVEVRSLEIDPQGDWLVACRTQVGDC